MISESQTGYYSVSETGYYEDEIYDYPYIKEIIYDDCDELEHHDQTPTSLTKVDLKNIKYYLEYDDY